MLGSCLSHPMHISRDGELVCKSVGRVDLLLDHFDSKQSRVCCSAATYMPFISWSCHHCLHIRQHKLVMDPYSGTDLVVMFHHCVKRCSISTSPSLSSVLVDFWLMVACSLLVSQVNDLVYPVFDGVGLVGFKSRSNAFLLA